jgi:hypothetical protein
LLPQRWCRLLRRWCAHTCALPSCHTCACTRPYAPLSSPLSSPLAASPVPTAVR